MIHKTNMDKSQVLPSINNRKRKRGMSRGTLELKINNRGGKLVVASTKTL